eukprot:TRINITY_DN20434_c0_g1_i1.p1 TRINITY_DN20434_c0_g1~~TRINITY_DN20434_c0_g1_i1.p1  ORF type:complete len:154 (-),score=11.03 TRINITY_DN20434_c0_g1_i1:131-544(-)
MTTNRFLLFFGAAAALAFGFGMLVAPESTRSLFSSIMLTPFGLAPLPEPGCEYGPVMSALTIAVGVVSLIGALLDSRDVAVALCGAKLAQGSILIYLVRSNVISAAWLGIGVLDIGLAILVYFIGDPRGKSSKSHSH